MDRLFPVANTFILSVSLCSGFYKLPHIFSLSLSYHVGAVVKYVRLIQREKTSSDLGICT